MARLDGRPLDPELLAVDRAVQRLQVERIVFEDRQPGDGIADAVIGRLQSLQPQVLLIRRFQQTLGKIEEVDFPAHPIHGIGELRDIRVDTVAINFLLYEFLLSKILKRIKNIN